MDSRSKTIGLIFITIAILSVVAGVVVFSSPRFEPFPLPDPNGYEDFVRAGRMLVVDTSDYDGASLEDLRAMVSSNASALEVMRAGLEKKCRVPLDYIEAETVTWATELPLLKAVAVAGCAEARLSLLDGDPNQAASIGLEIIQFGAECSRGGPLIHRLVGSAIQAIAAEPTHAAYQNLQASDCRRIAQELELIISTQEPLGDVERVERLWSKHAMGIRGRIRWVIETRSLQSGTPMTSAGFADCRQRLSDLKRLLLDMASRAYELENGHLPETFDALVPEYLKGVPIDPVTGDPMDRNQ